MKNCLVLVVLVLCLGCGGQTGKNTMFVPYENIAVSKEKGVFLAEYSAQDTLIKIGGKEFNVLSAWVEQPHYKRLFNDEIIDDYISVMNIEMRPGTFTEDEWRNMNVHHYIKEYGYTNSQIWFSLGPSKVLIKDTIIVEYRHPYTAEERKGVSLIRKK